MHKSTISDSINDAFFKRKRVSINSYIFWAQCMANKTWPPAITARKCVENILKSLIIKEYDKFGITEFTTTTYDQLKNQNIFGSNFRGTFGGSACLYLLRTHSDLLNSHLVQHFKIIIDSGNDDAHESVVPTERQSQDINKRLGKIANWYFKTEFGHDWKEKYVEPELTKLSASTLAKQIAKYLKEIEIDEKLESNKDSDVIEITPDYWDNLYKEWQAEKNKVYENFLLRSHNGYTRHFVALEAKKSKIIFDELKYRDIQVTHNKSPYETNFNALLKEAFSNKCTTLIKIFAPSGEGKTVFLEKIAYRYSRVKNPSISVFQLDTINEPTIKTLINKIIESNNLVLVLLDTPSKYGSEINSQLREIKQSTMSNPFVMVIADQYERYNKKLLGTFYHDFEEQFSEIFEINYAQEYIDKKIILDQISKLLSDNEIIIDIRILQKHLLENNGLSTREQIREIIKEGRLKFTVKHDEDWELFDKMVEKKEYKKYKTLFTFIAIFSHIGESVPIDLFNKGYLDGIDVLDIITLVNDNRANNILHISDDRKIEFRHEQIAKWYFEEEQHQLLGNEVFRKYLENFGNYNDYLGCYLFRNIHRKLYKSFLQNKPTPHKRKKILESFINSASRFPVDQNQLQQIHKTMMEICLLETDDLKQHAWLDRIIAENEFDFHAQTKRISLFIDEATNNDYSKAKDVLKKLKRAGHSDSYIHYYEYRIAMLEKSNYDLDKHLKNHPDRLSIIRSIASQEIKNGNFKEAENILKLITFEDEDIKTWLDIAYHYLKQGQVGHSKFILNRILEQKQSNIPSALLLHQIYDKEKNAEMSEITLTNCINNNSEIQVALVVSIAKLYRSKLYKNEMGIDVSIKKLAKLFDDTKNIGLLNQSLQFRTEYAKWCFESFPKDKKKYAEAISILKGTLKNSPYHIHSRTELGLIYQKSGYSGDIDKSKEILEETLEIDKDKKEVAFRVVLARTYVKLKEWRKAMIVLENAEEIDRNNLSTYRELVFVYQHFGDEKKESLNRVLKILAEKNDSKTSVYVTISDNYLKKDQADLALSIIENKLNKEPNNPILLNQKAKILMTLSSKENDIATKNSLLSKATRVLNNKILKDNPWTLTLQISAYDSFVLDEKIHRKEYLKNVSLRNKTIEQLFKLEPNNIYLRIILSKIFITSANLRLALEYLNVPDYYILALQDKMKILTQKKAVYKIFNDISKIELINNKFINIKKQYKLANINKLNKDFNKIIFKPRNNYKLISIWNKGKTNSDNTAVVRTKGGSYPVLGSNSARKIKEQVNPNSNMYFATFLQNNRQYANNLEPFFTRSQLNNLNHFLPNELNLIKY